MAQDFAKKRGTGTAGKKQTSRQPKTRGKPDPQPVKVWRWYGAGVATGVFVCFLMYLGTLPPEPGQPGREAATPENIAAPKPRFDFYTLLPQQTIEVEVDAKEIARTRSNPDTELYILQAGSFRAREDADRRRAELLLLGLEPNIEKSSGDNGRWFRVYVGPFESRSLLAKARSLTASQDIDTLLLKRSKP